MSKRAARFTFDQRASGLLLHPTSLPGRFGNGDLGPASHAFAAFLKTAGQRWWQMLPVGPPGEGNSPYSAQSAFAGNPSLVSPEILVAEKLLDRSDIAKPPRFDVDRVEFGRAGAFRIALLRKAFTRFRERGGDASAAFKRFVHDSKFWLEDFALFAALKVATGNKPWSAWDTPVRTRTRAGLAEASRRLADEIQFQRFVQFEFDRQWTSLRDRCDADGIGLIGDIPIFVAYDSAEVWARPDLFLLTRDRRPKVVSGCPPDFFNADGQRWNHPHYDWKAHEKENFRWWIERFRATLRWFDAVRIDHFLGFHRVWAIPATSKTAKHGRYTPGPGAAFFETLRTSLGDVPIIAEDLGTVTQQALDLRDRFNFPGMRVLQFGFGGGDYHLPHRYPHRAVAYTGTHDNDTTAGWFKSVSATEKKRVRDYVGADARASCANIVWSLIRQAMSSVADTSIVPVQDLLALGRESRMNMPGNASGNWGWRMKPDKLTPTIAARLSDLCKLYGRA